MNHYQTLGVAPTATQEEIRTAWRALCSKHHPDRGGDPATMAQINEAYRVLSDAKLRKAYDLGQSVHQGQELSKEAQAVQLLVRVMRLYDDIKHPQEKMQAIKQQAEKTLRDMRKEQTKLTDQLEAAKVALAEDMGLWETSSDQPNIFEVAAQVRVDELEAAVKHTKSCIEGLLSTIELLGTYSLTKRGNERCAEELRRELETPKKELTTDDLLLGLTKLFEV